jgi:hypothetical protein
MHRQLLRVLPFLLVLQVACAGSHGPSSSPAPTAAALPLTEFAILSQRISEPGGFFPSDNLVSNESSYLHVLTTLDSLGVKGGAYVGVGPDQNYSYIAQIKPEIAFLIDIRRDAVLQHLMYKALFERARNRLEYMCLLLGRPVPHDPSRWDSVAVGQLVATVDSLPLDSALFEKTELEAHTAMQRYGVSLTAEDFTTIRSIHLAFAREGLNVRYNTVAAGRGFSGASRYLSTRIMVLKDGVQTVISGNTGPPAAFPQFDASVNWRRLLQETDLTGRQRSYLTSETNFQYLKEMHRRNLIIPVVGDLAGPHALADIGREIAARGLRVSAFYVSNVEQYLMPGPSFTRFAEVVAGMPFDGKSVIIRSYFQAGHPHNVVGHRSTQLVERIETFAAVQRTGGYTSYQDLVSRNAVPPPRQRLMRKMQLSPTQH